MGIATNALLYGWAVLAGVNTNGPTIFSPDGASRGYVKPCDMIELALAFTERHMAAGLTPPTYSHTFTATNDAGELVTETLNNTIGNAVDVGLLALLSGIADQNHAIWGAYTYTSGFHSVVGYPPAAVQTNIFAAYDVGNHTNKIFIHRDIIYTNTQWVVNYTNKFPGLRFAAGIDLLETTTNTYYAWSSFYPAYLASTGYSIYRGCTTVELHNVYTTRQYQAVNRATDWNFSVNAIMYENISNWPSVELVETNAAQYYDTYVNPYALYKEQLVDLAKAFYGMQTLRRDLNAEGAHKSFYDDAWSGKTFAEIEAIAKAGLDAATPTPFLAQFNSPSEQGANEDIASVYSGGSYFSGLDNSYRYLSSYVSNLYVLGTFTNVFGTAKHELWIASYTGVLFVANPSIYALPDFSSYYNLPADEAWEKVYSTATVGTFTNWAWNKGISLESGSYPASWGGVGQGAKGSGISRGMDLITPGFRYCTNKFW